MVGIKSDMEGSSSSIFSHFSDSVEMESSVEHMPIPNEKSGKKVMSQVDKLLIDAFRYSSHSDHSMPSGFLRERVPAKWFNPDEDEELTVKKSNKTSKKKKTPSKVPLKIPSKSKVVKKITKVVNKTNKVETVSNPKGEGAKKNNKGKTTKKTSVPRIPKAALKIEVEKKENGPTSFINLSLPDFKLQYNMFDIEYLQNNIEYDGAPIPSTALTNKYYEPNEKNSRTPPKTVQLKYPLWFNYQEEYHLDFNNDMFNTVYNPMAEIGKNIEYTTEIYIPKSYQKQFRKEVILPLNKAFDLGDTASFISVVNKYNEMLQKIPRCEIIEKLKTTNQAPNKFLHDLLHVVYTRSIHPKAKKLKQYAAFSSYVYGELLPSFLSEVYAECDLNSDQIFMDLGSGVGNCVVQASLEYGCKLSFGCEIMENASDLTEAQYHELLQRCKLFGIKIRPVEYSLRKSFIDNDRVDELIRECDVLLVNNFLFDAEINNKVQKLIQNCKSGCKIISLKSLRPLTYTIDFDDVDNILNKLRVTRHNLKENSVSWTHRGGEFFISEVLNDLDDSLFSGSAGYRNKSRPKYTR